LFQASVTILAEAGWSLEDPARIWNSSWIPINLLKKGFCWQCVNSDGTDTTSAPGQCLMHQARSLLAEEAITMAVAPTTAVLACLALLPSSTRLMPTCSA